MKTDRNLIWIALLGIAAVFLVRPLLQNKPSADRPTAVRIIAASPKVSDSIDRAPTVPPTPSMIISPTIAPPIANAEPVSPPADDPEKIAVEISTLSEAEVCQWLGNLTNPDLTGNTGRLLIRRWVELNPTAAVNWVTQLHIADGRPELMDVVAIAWSEKDLPNALNWVESLPEDATKHQALADLGYEVARVDPVDAMQIATQLPASDYANGLLLHSLAQYASTDLAQSQQLALSLPQGSLRDQTLSTVAIVQARQDGAGAASFAVENIPPGPGLDRAVIGIIQLWGQNSFTAASAWVQSFPDSTLYDQAAQSLGMVGAR